MAGKYVVCEGIDAAGKTTTIHHAIKILKERNVDCEYVKGLKSYGIFGKISSSIPSTFTLSLELYVMDLFKIRSLLKSGKTIIQDRWFDSVYFHNKETGYSRFMRRIFNKTRPDIYIFFDVSLEERLERLKLKEKSIDHSMLLENPRIIYERNEQFLNAFNNYGIEKYIIDTTGKSVEETGKRLAEIIGKQ